uniref:Uncharacterized protein n=1 Tax=Glossina palpalis gambiensis TaxID=67801 RepID=A0A1B0B6D3_9MUSC
MYSTYRINKNLLLLLCISVCNGYTRFFLFFFFNTFLSFHDLAKVFSCLGVFFQGQVYTISLLFNLEHDYSKVIPLRDFPEARKPSSANSNQDLPLAFANRRVTMPQYSSKCEGFKGVVERGRSTGHIFNSILARSLMAMVGDSLWLCFEGVEVRGGLGGVCRDRSTVIATSLSSSEVERDLRRGSSDAEILRLSTITLPVLTFILATGVFDFSSSEVDSDFCRCVILLSKELPDFNCSLKSPEINKNLLLLLCISVCNGYTSLLFNLEHDYSKVIPLRDWREKNTFCKLCQISQYLLTLDELLLERLELACRVGNCNSSSFPEARKPSSANSNQDLPLAFANRRVTMPQYSSKCEGFKGVVERGRSTGHIFNSILARSLMAMVGDSLWLCFEGVEVRGGLGGVCRDRSTVIATSLSSSEVERDLRRGSSDAEILRLSTITLPVLTFILATGVFDFSSSEVDINSHTLDVTPSSSSGLRITVPWRPAADSSRIALLLIVALVSTTFTSAALVVLSTEGRGGIVNFPEPDDPLRAPTGLRAAAAAAKSLTVIGAAITFTGSALSLEPVEVITGVCDLLRDCIFCNSCPSIGEEDFEVLAGSVPALLPRFPVLNIANTDFCLLVPLGVFPTIICPGLLMLRRCVPTEDFALKIFESVKEVGGLRFGEDSTLIPSANTACVGSRVLVGGSAVVLNPPSTILSTGFGPQNDVSKSIRCGEGERDKPDTADKWLTAEP